MPLVLACPFRILQRPLPRILCQQRPSFLGMFPVIPAAHTHTQSTSRPSNKHLSVDAEGNTHVDLEFIEEPLGISAEQGHGFLRVEFGDAIGPDRRYRIVRKLGWGMNSSIWMAFDKQEQRYAAIKALKGYATDLVKRNIMWELAALERICSRPPILGFTSTHCTQLLSHFMHPGKDQDGDHVCLVTDILGGDVKSFQVGMNSVLPLPLVKRILLHTLRGIAHMHSCNIIHTDLKHDNIMFDASSLTNDDFAALLEADPSRRHPPEESWNCTVQAAVSQPLPLLSLSEAMERTYIVSDFGSAQPSTLHTVDNITANALRPPEIILRGPWDEKVDIWTFGCLVFELAVGRELFEYTAYEKYSLDAPAAHLWQMMCFTGERFTPEQLQASDLAAQYFDCTCNLKSRPPNFRNPFVTSLRNYKALGEEDVLATAAFMHRCLRLDPKNRATAEELLQDTWWQGAA